MENTQSTPAVPIVTQPVDQAPARPPSVRSIFASDIAQKKFTEMLGKKAQGFITSILQIVNSNSKLGEADPWTVYYAACTAATMDLPINQNLGFAWIVPYKHQGVQQAQFQMGYKGYNQLALRTGQYLRLNAIPVYPNQFKSWNNLTEELEADFSIEGEGDPVGYLAYFKLINGFEKTVYWSKARVLKHAKKYSQSFEHATGKWKTDFDAMALKTVLKNALSKWGILSIEMQKAILVDQAVILDEDGDSLTFPDNPPDEEEKPEDKASKAAKATEDKLNRKTGNGVKDTAQKMEGDTK